MRSLAGCTRVWFVLGLVAAGVAGASAGAPPEPQSAAPAQPPAGPSCRVTGRVTSGREPLPGASVVVHAGDALKAATSTNVDGTFSILVAPNISYRVAAELTAFTTSEKTIALGDPPCDTAADFQLALVPRRPPSAKGRKSRET